MFERLSGKIPDQYYHGTPDTRNMHGKKGVHVGTKIAASQALQARIGVPAQGEWDGTRKYGDTLLAGRKRLKERAKELGYFVKTGFNSSGVPEEDYYPKDRAERAHYSDGTKVPFDAVPSVFPVEIVGRMTNNEYYPHSDSMANGLILRSIKGGRAKSGFYYLNDGEDGGSISAVVPDWTFLRIS